MEADHGANDNVTTTDCHEGLDVEAADEITISIGGKIHTIKPPHVAAMFRAYSSGSLAGRIQEQTMRRIQAADEVAARSMRR